MRQACLQAVRSAEPGWADVSAAAGFADQAHLVREFRDVYGWPPRLVHEYLRQIEHAHLVAED
jgi:AraC-like DNA-binding protein